MNVLHSDIFGRRTRDKEEHERSSPDDHLMVEWDESGRLHDLRFVTSLPPSNKVNNEQHTATVYEPPLRGLSVHQGKSIQWMFWNETDFRDLRFYGTDESTGSEDLWVGKEYEIYKVTIYRSWGRIVGFSVSAKIEQMNDNEDDEGEGEEENDENRESEDEERSNRNQENQRTIVEAGFNTSPTAQNHPSFFFTDDHIWYIQIALLIFASLIILVMLLVGYTQ